MDTTLENRGSTTVAGSICPAEQETEIKMNVALEEQFILCCKSFFAFYWCSELLSSDLALFTTVDFLNVVSNIMTEENWGYGWHKVQFCWLYYSPSAFLLLMMILIVIGWWLLCNRVYFFLFSGVQSFFIWLFFTPGSCQSTLFQVTQTSS